MFSGTAHYINLINFEVVLYVRKEGQYYFSEPGHLNLQEFSSPQ